MTERPPAADETPVRRVLLLGANGRLGTAIRNEFARRTGNRSTPIGTRLIAPARGELALDAMKPLETSRRWLDRWKPHAVVNCIATSDVDRCERQAREAKALNGDFPGALARAARERNVRLIHFSTDFVFDGTLRRPYREDDATNPLSVYGSTKLAGETAIASEGGRYWIFRVSWLYGGPSRNLAATLLDPANARRAIALAGDRVGVPNPVGLLAREIAQAIGRDENDAAAAADAPRNDETANAQPEPGVYHLSCRGATTWHAFGREFLERAIAAGRIPAAQAPRIEPYDGKTQRRPARRPEWSALDSTLYESVFGRKLPSWREAIDFALQ